MEMPSQGLFNTPITVDPKKDEILNFWHNFEQQYFPPCLSQKMDKQALNIISVLIHRIILSKIPNKALNTYPRS